MIKIEKTDVFGWEASIRGMRNPMNSWDKSDSKFNVASSPTGMWIGANDLKLMKSLSKAGSDHRKFLRQIFVSVDLTAPLYWWKEYDTYKVGTTANSTSTMHKIHAKPFDASDFSCERMVSAAKESLDQTIETLEKLRLDYLETKDKDTWYSIIQLLPTSYNQMRTCTMTYENLVNMYFARRHHKLDEWHVFCAWCETLPYFKEICIQEGDSNE